MTFIGESQTGTIINGENINWIFKVNSSVSLILQNLTLANGRGGDVGGAIINSGTLTVEDCTITGNHADYGGAILNVGTCNVTGCTFTDNTAGAGGAIDNDDGTCNVTGCTFTGNTANWGGAIYNENGLCNVIGSTFTNNNATIGGAISNGLGTCNVIDCTFAGNNATSYNGLSGGVIFNYCGNCTVNGSTFTGNSVTGDSSSSICGGGVIFNYCGNCTVRDSTFTSNSVTGDSSSSICGGVIYNTDGNCTVSDSTFTSNNAGDWGGAIYNTVGNCTVTSCTFTDNIAGIFGGAIYNNGTCSVANCTFNGNHADLGGGAIFNGGACNVTVSGSTFTGNTATNSGGAITICGKGDVDGCTFTGNTADYGGAIYIQGTLNVTGSTFTNNHAINGGVILTYGMLIANFNRFYNNTATNGKAIANGDLNTMNLENNWWGTNNPNLNWSEFIFGYSHHSWWIYMNLTANATNPLYGDQVNLTANFNYLSNGTSVIPLTGGYIPDSLVIFASNDGSLNPLSKNTMNGLASSIFTPTKAGSVTVNATLDNQTCSLTFNVDKGIPSVSVDSVHNFAGQTVNLIAYIVDQNGNPVNQGEVTFKVGNAAEITVTVLNGIARIDNWTIPATWNVGNYTILVNYLENSNYTASSGTGNLTVTKTPTSITAQNVHNFAGQIVTLTANVKDYYNQPENNGSVIFTINGVTVVKSVVDGVASIDWTIPNWDVGIYDISAIFNGTGTNYLNSTNSSTLTVDKTQTNIIMDNVSGNKGKIVTLKATLTDYYGTPLNNKLIEFYVDNVKVGENSTDINGLAVFNYNITQIGGNYITTAKFLGDSQYLASTGNGTLKVNQSSVYVNVTTSKTNPYVGETITLTFKLGNNGPDPADDVVFTYVIPEGMEFVSIETEPGYPAATYNATTRTITWPLGTVPKLDPWIKLKVLVLNSGAFNVNPTVTTSTYDPTLGNDIQHITINAVQAANAASTSRTIGMQETGIPINYLILAILAVISGLILPKRK